jgi:outer membrane protein OmpA-like peptidoglycan-associated protein
LFSDNARHPPKQMPVFGATLREAPLWLGRKLAEAADVQAIVLANRYGSVTDSRLPNHTMEVSSINRLFVTACLLTGALLANGCATKKYVRNTVATVQAKVDQVGDQTSHNAQAIDETRNQLSEVDERAQTGISAAQERAATADRHAATADQHANEAMSRANQVAQVAEGAASGVDNLRQVVSNIDDYEMQTSVSVLFNFNRYTLTPEAKRQLDGMVMASKSDTRFFFTVEGFTDNVGSREYNNQLSRRRADSVVHYLVTRYDIPIYRIHIVGLGQDKPVAQGRAAAARAQNRRVEVRVFSADGVAAALNSHSENSASRSAEPEAVATEQNQ